MQHGLINLTGAWVSIVYDDVIKPQGYATVDDILTDLDMQQHYLITEELASQLIEASLLVMDNFHVFRPDGWDQVERYFTGTVTPYHQYVGEVSPVEEKAEADTFMERFPDIVMPFDMLESLFRDNLHKLAEVDGGFSQHHWRTFDNFISMKIRPEIKIRATFSRKVLLNTYVAIKSRITSVY